jgi:hypothetical protein
MEKVRLRWISVKEIFSLLWPSYCSAWKNILLRRAGLHKSRVLRRSVSMDFPDLVGRRFGPGFVRLAAASFGLQADPRSLLANWQQIEPINVDTGSLYFRANG